MLLVIDNYDSFTYNLVHFLGELGAEPVVYRNDKITVDAIAAMAPEAIVLSPGPCTPNEAGICLDVVDRLGTTTPILGVCLGHQAIGQAYGARIDRAPTLMHGKLSRIHHTGRSVFRGLNDDFNATRYHSLTIAPETLPDTLEATATADGTVIMGAMHKTHPVHGVQFHPESIASEHGHRILRNFLDLADAWNAERRPETSVA
ncbi:anthranilate synthase component II [Bauldia sp.]|uniref:anthranilate synthase component II n=1 Tax=Bauldia sp. TaxID=2575872 RepID=UPI003BAC034E